MILFIDDVEVIFLFENNKNITLSERVYTSLIHYGKNQFTYFQPQVDRFTYPRSSVSLTGNDMNTRLAKPWTANDSLSVIRKSNPTDKIKRSFFQAAVVSVLLYGCTTWTLTKRMEKKLDGNYTRMLRAILNKSCSQHPSKQQLNGHLSPISKTKSDGTLLEK